MRGDMYYLSPETSAQIEKLVNDFTGGAKSISSEDLLEKLQEVLPIQKMNRNSVKRRVEGFYHATELLFKFILDKRILDRQQIVLKAKLRPLSYYHYLTGSREPADNVQTRDDYLNDPTTALVKLRDDILGLARLMPQL